MKTHTLATLALLLCQASVLHADEPQGPVLRFVDRPPAARPANESEPQNSLDPGQPSFSFINDEGQVITGSVVKASVIMPADPVAIVADQETISPQDLPSNKVDRGGWKRLSEISIRVNLADTSVPAPTVTRPDWDTSESQLIAVGGDRGTGGFDVQWEPTELWYRPLYFEDTNLERYGFRYSAVQPLASAAHFFGRVPVLPYLRGTDPAHQQVTALGHRRPGSPDMIATRGTFQPSLRGSVYQAGATVGGVFLVP